ncbi:MAG: DegT/DnrJ/EryC1/StrS family aminotransferase [Bdellovibrionales bacterium]
MSRSEFLSFSPPCLSEAEVEAAAEVLRAGVWLSSGPKTKEFEEKFAHVVQAPKALALNSCTAGLHLGLKILGVRPGDEVITTPMTFCATANVVEHLGGTVVLADVEPDTLLISPEEISKKITSKTRVITPVHYAGHPCDMAKINSFGTDKTFVLEDAAHCMPSRIGEKPVGASGNLTAFSFYANKNMTTGEGGMLTGTPDLIDQARMMALHGMSKGAYDRFNKGGQWRYDVPEPGFKYNMTDMAAAIGLAQLSRLDELYKRRMAMVETYNRELASSDVVQIPKVKKGYQSSYHLYFVQLNLDRLKLTRDEFLVQMQERNIGCSVHYLPIHMLSFYAKKYGWKPGSFPVAEKAFERLVSLPLSSRYTPADAMDVVEAIHDIGKKFRR